MKTTPKKKGLTFGEFLAGVYEVVGTRKARELVGLAVNSGQVGFCGPLRCMVS